jgi:hypothetical protein
MDHVTHVMMAITRLQPQSQANTFCRQMIVRNATPAQLGLPQRLAILIQR